MDSLDVFERIKIVDFDSEQFKMDLQNCFKVMRVAWFGATFSWISRWEKGLFKKHEEFHQAASTAGKYSSVLCLCVQTNIPHQ